MNEQKSSSPEYSWRQLFLLFRSLRQISCLGFDESLFLVSSLGFLAADGLQFFSGWGHGPDKNEITSKQGSNRNGTYQNQASITEENCVYWNREKFIGNSTNTRGEIRFLKSNSKFSWTNKNNNCFPITDLICYYR